ncbi:hypothetical protein [Rhodopirellula baltica]|uniref:hypothetical protein n=1 Tax=Rhodopirellula baltica TaxID=265606 RepID=UPI0011817CB9|nr:hypothetical protein [Rhodopirellula baltica]
MSLLILRRDEMPDMICVPDKPRPSDIQSAFDSASFNQYLDDIREAVRYYGQTDKALFAKNLKKRLGVTHSAISQFIRKDKPTILKPERLRILSNVVSKHVDMLALEQRSAIAGYAFAMKLQLGQKKPDWQVNWKVLIVLDEVQNELRSANIYERVAQSVPDRVARYSERWERLSRSLDDSAFRIFDDPRKRDSPFSLEHPRKLDADDVRSIQEDLGMGWSALQADIDTEWPNRILNLGRKPPKMPDGCSIL